jgi:hypothetical protein
MRRVRHLEASVLPILKHRRDCSCVNCAQYTGDLDTEEFILFFFVHLILYSGLVRADGILSISRAVMDGGVVYGGGGALFMFCAQPLPS